MEIQKLFNTTTKRNEKTMMKYVDDYIMVQNLIKNIEEMIDVTSSNTLGVYRDSNHTVDFTVDMDNGENVFKYDVARTNTQKCINGGMLVRENAYIPVKYLIEIK